MMSSWQLDAFVDRMWDLSGPILNNMGFSGLLGACTAAALKVRRWLLDIVVLALGFHVSVRLSGSFSSCSWW